MKKINCGGFYINENDFNIDEEGKLNLKPNGGGNGYTIDETRTEFIPEQTVTTGSIEEFTVNGYFANVTESAFLSETFPDAIVLTADGVEYILPKLEFAGAGEDATANVIAYGAIADMSTIDWSNYPVQVMCIKMFASDQWTVFVVTETAGTYTVKAEYISRAMAVSPEFQGAVAKSMEPLVLTCEFTSLTQGTHNSTAAEIDQAIRSNREIVVVTEFNGQNLRLKMQYAIEYNSGYYIAMFVAVDTQNNVMFVTNTIAANADDNRFVISYYGLTPNGD